ncbi:MAG: hypothetical protein GY851_18985 [bacterium]|nr:hypothetical protein [bacterium]
MDIVCDRGLCAVTLSRGAIKEQFLSFKAAVGESAAALFDRAAATVRESGAAPVCQDVFGLTPEQAGSAFTSAFGACEWPVTWVGDARDDDSPYRGTQVWLVSGTPVTPIVVDGALVGTHFEDDYASYCRLGGLTGADVGGTPIDQTGAVFDTMIAGLAQSSMTFKNVVRTWFYNRDILDWYDAFNKRRDVFFREHDVFRGLVPASTGMGGGTFAGQPQGPALSTGLLGVKSKGDAMTAAPLPSPLQCPAIDYGSSFSRAAEICTPDLRRITVSGTASIAPEGHTVFLDDTPGQIALTMDVVHAILESREMGWRDVGHATVYFKHPDGLPAFKAYCAEREVCLPAAYLNEDVCRGNLLFEIELCAVAAIS